MSKTVVKQVWVGDNLVRRRVTVKDSKPAAPAPTPEPQPEPEEHVDVWTKSELSARQKPDLVALCEENEISIVDEEGKELKKADLVEALMDHQAAK